MNQHGVYFWVGRSPRGRCASPRRLNTKRNITHNVHKPGVHDSWVGPAFMKKLMQCLLVITLIGVTPIAASQPKSTSDTSEVYEFQIDKSIALKTAIDFFEKKRHLLKEYDTERPLFSSIKGLECNGKPARYIIVSFRSRVRLNKFKSVIFNVTRSVTDQSKWQVFAGPSPDSLQTSIYTLRMPDFPRNILCGD